MSIESVEPEKFSNNAAEIALDRGVLTKLLEDVGCELQDYNDGYKTECPVCRQSKCFVGVKGGRHHRVYWKCYSSTCDSSKMPRNLLTFVRQQLPKKSLKEALERISAFLGFAGRSYDITNGKYQLKSKPTPMDGTRKSLTPTDSDESHEKNDRRIGKHDPSWDDFGNMKSAFDGKDNVPF